MTCTRNCNQGRQCDCEPDLPIQYTEPDDMEAFDWWVIACAMALVFCAGLIFAKVFL